MLSVDVKSRGIGLLGDLPTINRLHIEGVGAVSSLSFISCNCSISHSRLLMDWFIHFLRTEEWTGTVDRVDSIMPSVYLINGRIIHHIPKLLSDK